MFSNKFSRSPLTFYRSPWPTLGFGAMGFLLALALALALLFVTLAPTPSHPLPLADWLAWLRRLSWTAALLGSGVRLGTLVQLLMDRDAVEMLQVPKVATALTHAWGYGLAAALAFTLPLCGLVWILTPLKRDARWVAGPRLIEGPGTMRRARRALQSALRTGTSIELAPGVPLPKEREIRSFVLLGGQRSGKTVSLRSLLRQLIVVRHKLVVHDTKGDMTATWPNDDVVLLAPHDARSWAWDVGHDIIGGAAAFELATALIPTPDKEPIWAQGAQQILTGILIALQRLHGTAWGWRELDAALKLSPDALNRMIQEHYPLASQFVALEKGEYTRSAASFVTSLMGPAARLIQPLAAAWGDLDPRYRLSLREWVKDGYEGPRTLILQRSPAFAEMSSLWIGSVISRFVSITGGPEFPDSATRRIWLAIDEFPQLGKIKGLFEVPATHAAKGVTLVLALQSLGQLTESYGAEARELLGQLTGTKLVFRLQAEDAAYVAEKWVGKWRYQKPERSWKEKPGSWIGEADTKWRPDEAALLLPSYFNGLKPNRNGVEGLVIGLDGDDVYRMAWAYEDWPEQRKASDPAAWVAKIPQPVEGKK